MFKDAISFTVAVALAVAAMFGLGYLGWASYNYFAPKYRATDAAVYHESEQYNEGMIRDLENLQMEYMKANDTQRAALKDIILHRFSVYPTDKLPPNLFAFYNDLRTGRL